VRPNEARPRSGDAAKESGRSYGLTWFEMICLGGGISIWIGYLISEFYFTLTVVIVMALAMIALLIEGIEIR